MSAHEGPFFADTFAGNVKLPITDVIDLHEPSKQALMPVYRGVCEFCPVLRFVCENRVLRVAVLNLDGSVRTGSAAPSHSKEELLRVYGFMVRLRVRGRVPYIFSLF